MSFGISKKALIISLRLRSILIMSLDYQLLNIIMHWQRGEYTGRRFEHDQG
jgi:hypothetical protein